MGDDQHTHRVVRKAHHRSTDGPGTVEQYAPGDELTPTDAELEAFPDRFARISEPSGSGGGTDESDESGATSDDGDETGDAPGNDTDAAEAADSDENEESEPVGAPPEPLTESWVEAAGYHDLRGVASRFEDVNGNWGEDRLEAELLDRAESESDGDEESEDA